MQVDLRHAADVRSFRQVNHIFCRKPVIEVQIEGVLPFYAGIIRTGGAQRGLDVIGHAFGLDDGPVLIIVDRGVHIGKVPPGIHRPPAAVQVGLNKHRGHVGGLILNAVQPVGKPAGQDLVPQLAVDHRVVEHVVPVLMQDQGPGLPRLFESLHHQIRLFCIHVEVIQPLHDQGGALNVLPVLRIIGFLPDRGVIAVGRQLILGDLPEPGAIFPVLYRPIVVQEGAAAVIARQRIGIADVKDGRHALGIRIIVPAGDAGGGDDGFQTADAGGGDLKGQRPAV